jgi:hypothetical protein
MSDKEPWLDEPDLDYWHIAEYLCVVRRAPWGHLCGYVGVGSKHPLYGLDSDSLGDILCHGGINWAAPLDEFTGWFFGFHCGHFRDYSPYVGRELARAGATPGLIRETEALFGIRENDPGIFRREYRDRAYVLANCAAIVAQLMDLAEDGDALAAIARRRAGEAI